ncbi:MAG: histone deacetylase family protein [Gammaproteobacteria bacterium]
MITVHSDRQALHHSAGELTSGRFVPAFEQPGRIDAVLAALEAAALGPVIAAAPADARALRGVHTDDYVGFLRDAWTLWRAQRGEHDALPLNWRAPGMRRIRPDSIDGLLSYYSFDAGTPITAGTWDAVLGATGAVLEAQRLVAAGARAAFALTRPPGHHAGRNFYGGYCYANSAAIAAQAFRDGGAARVAVLDVDYHHGNGTQEIFYERADVLTVSIHADTRVTFPYFLGHADETGDGDGDGYHLNLPLPHGTAWNTYESALDAALLRVADHAPDAVVVSLGLDTFDGDPISHFRLQERDFAALGAMLATLDTPTLLVFEGGYAIEALGANTVAVLRGFDNGA